jgi:DNA invertase Pin-like site-specific DNA recombinase
MLDKTIEPNERITTAHRKKLAYVYVRQSTAGQVRQHQESTELRYRLVNRAVLFGWPRRIEVIDEDLGKSGASSEARQGFQRLIAEIGLAKAGLVLSLDASRLARNNRDWHQLLELCSLFGVLIADSERLYDPRTYHDRLLLGLSGIMSEAELHQIQVRLHQGERQKAARGELRMPLPAGLARDSAGTIVLNPDQEVQGRFQLVFAEFRKLQSATAVTMVLRRADLQVPVRPISGSAPHAVVWREANATRALQILKNPAYAGGLGTRPSALVGNMTPWSPRIAWWHDRSNSNAKRSYGSLRRLTALTNVGALSKQHLSPTPTVTSLKHWRRTCLRFGGRQRQRRSTANKSCVFLFVVTPYTPSKPSKPLAGASFWSPAGNCRI